MNIIRQIETIRKLQKAVKEGRSNGNLSSALYFADQDKSGVVTDVLPRENLGYAIDSVNERGNLNVGRGGALSTTQYSKPMEEYLAGTTVTPQGNLLDLPTDLTPEDLYYQGTDRAFGTGGKNVGLIHPYDRSSADNLITQVGGIHLKSPQYTHGGIKYGMRDFAADNHPHLIGANAPSAANTIAKARDRLYDEGAENVIGMTSLMGGRSDAVNIDYARTVLNMIDSRPISKSLGDEMTTSINNALATASKQSVAKGGDPFPPMPSLVNKDGKVSKAARKWFETSNQGPRGVALSAFDKAGFRKKGGPDVVAARLAVDDPDLIHAPSGMVGGFTGIHTRNSPLIDAPQYNPTFTAGLQGVPLGALDFPIPEAIMLPDFTAARRLEGKDPAKDNRALLSPTSQQLDQKWLDTQMDFRDRLVSGDYEDPSISDVMEYLDRLNKERR
jgi:hypothetical protein